MAYPLQVISGPSEKDLMFALFDGVFQRSVEFTFEAYSDGTTRIGQTQSVRVYISGLEREGTDEWKVKTAWDGDFHVEIRFNPKTREGFVSAQSVKVDEDGVIKAPDGRTLGRLKCCNTFSSVRS